MPIFFSSLESRNIKSWHLHLCFQFKFPQNKSHNYFLNEIGFLHAELKPFHANWSISIPPENIRKPLVFRGYRKRPVGMKWVNPIAQNNYFVRNIPPPPQKKSSYNKSPFMINPMLLAYRQPKYTDCLTLTG